jgi:hypothetical protein
VPTCSCGKTTRILSRALIEERKVTDEITVGATPALFARTRKRLYVDPALERAAEALESRILAGEALRGEDSQRVAVGSDFPEPEPWAHLLRDCIARRVLRKEALRCLTRHLARVVYRTLRAIEEEKLTSKKEPALMPALT